MVGLLSELSVPSPELSFSLDEVSQALLPATMVNGDHINGSTATARDFKHYEHHEVGIMTHLTC
jgi:hypothetical protein